MGFSGAVFFGEYDVVIVLKFFLNKSAIFSCQKYTNMTNIDEIRNGIIDKLL